MAITRCGDWGIRPDRRFGKSWGKLTGVASIDLSKENGYSLSGEWVRWEDAVVVGDGEYLVIGAVTGSVQHSKRFFKNHKYQYRLVAGGDEVRLVGGDEIDQIIAGGVRDGSVSQEQHAKSQNSTLYKYALFISLTAETAAADAAADAAAYAAEVAESLPVSIYTTSDGSELVVQPTEKDYLTKRARLCVERDRLTDRIAEIDSLLRCSWRKK